MSRKNRNRVENTEVVEVQQPEIQAEPAVAIIEPTNTEVRPEVVGADLPVEPTLVEPVAETKLEASEDTQMPQIVPEPQKVIDPPSEGQEDTNAAGLAQEALYRAKPRYGSKGQNLHFVNGSFRKCSPNTVINGVNFSGKWICQVLCPVCLAQGKKTPVLRATSDLHTFRGCAMHGPMIRAQERANNQLAKLTASQS